MAGHSHWSKIKRAKGANDAKRGKIWSKIARKIIIAAKNGGDPRDNLNLRYTIDEAKAANMPRDTIEKAIKKGTGELGAENYEAATYEGYAPGGVAMIIEGLTNNPARTAPDLRSILEKNGGNLATRGAVAFQFTKQGVITIKSDARRRGQADGDRARSRRRGREERGRGLRGHHHADGVPQGEGSDRGREDRRSRPARSRRCRTARSPIDAEPAQKLLKLIDLLEDNDDVQSVSHNAEIPESVGV